MNSAKSVFLFGTLRHRPLLRAVLGYEANGTPAELRGYRVVRVTGKAHPAIREAIGGVAKGLLLSVGAAGKARLDYYEAVHRYGLRSLVVETSEGPSTAEVYFPIGDQVVEDSPWSLEAWADQHGAAVTIAAAEVMSLMGHLSADEVGERYAPMLTRAHSRLRAEAEPAPAVIRREAGAGSVAVAEARQPYTGFFAVAESDLRFLRFDGGLSRQVKRAAFLMGDAVTVLPYDPVRDHVMLIEQFRFGPYMRGDPRPWSLEPVAGRIDPGEGPEAAARRETQEEAGLLLGKLHHVASYYPSPGAVTEYLWSYVGLADLPEEAAGLGGVASEEEDILAHILPFARLMELIGTGEAANAPLILTAYWLAMNRARLGGA